MSLSTIADLCLLSILDRIPIQDLLSTVNLVCQRWAQLRPVACNRRRTLILYHRKHVLYRETHQSRILYIPYIPFIRNREQRERHILILPDMNDRVCGQLVTLLPGITRFHIGYSLHWWPQFTIQQQINLLEGNWPNNKLSPFQAYGYMGIEHLLHILQLYIKQRFQPQVTLRLPRYNFRHEYENRLMQTTYDFKWQSMRRFKSATVAIVCTELWNMLSNI